MNEWSMEHCCSDTNRGRLKFREKNLSHLLCPPQIRRGLAWDCTPVSAVRGRRVTAQAMAQPITSVVIGPYSESLSPSYSLVWYSSKVHFNVLFFRVIYASKITVLTWRAVNFSIIFRTLNVFL